MRHLVLFATLVLAACESHSPPPIPPPPQATALPAVYEFSLAPSAWTFQFSPGMPRNPQAEVQGWSFDFPSGPDAAGAPSVHYLTTGVPGRITGSTLQVEYEITEVGTPVYQGKFGDPANTCPGGAHFDLYLQRRGDDLTAAKQFFRWFKRAGILAPGRGSLVVPLATGDWGSALGIRSIDAITQWLEALASPAAIGMTFGWGCFAGHGVNIAPGTGVSRFAITRFGTE